MKRSGGGNTYFSLLHNLNITMDESSSEYEAAAILLELPFLIAESKSRSRSRFEFSFEWGATRKRSSAATSTAETLPSSPLPSLPSPPSVPVAAVGPTPATTCETEKDKRPKALSPTTPFLFSPSESDEKTKHHPKRKVSLKRKKEEYLKMEEQLTESNRIFKEEIKKLKSYYDQQKPLNLKLKAAMEKETMIFSYLQMQQQQTQLSLNRAMEPTSTQSAVQLDTNQGQRQQSQCMPHQQPFITNQAAHSHIIGSSPYSQTQNISFFSSYGGAALFMINDKRLGPSLPLDLNIPLDECFKTEARKSEEDKRAMAAQARQRRIRIWKSKTNKRRTRSPLYS